MTAQRLRQQQACHAETADAEQHDRGGKRAGDVRQRVHDVVPRRQHEVEGDIDAPRHDRRGGPPALGAHVGDEGSFRHVRAVNLRDIPAIDVAGCHLHLVRQTLGLTAFGANAYSADAGGLLIEPHTESGGGGAANHEELYVVVSGRATFTVGGDEIDAPAGTLVLAQPDEHREATATEDGTWALVIGGQPGAAGPISPWEHYFAAAGEEDPARSYEVAARGLDDWPDHPSLHYSLGCYAALAGMRDQALEHLRVAFAGEPKARRWAAEDSDLDSIREELSGL